MLPPIEMNFDYEPGADLDAAIVHVPKIYQGAPYRQELRLRASPENTYEDFTQYDEIRMDVRKSQKTGVILSLSKSAGHFITTETSLTLAFPGTATKTILVDVRNERTINEALFVYDIYLLQAGVVQRKFAQGIGYLVGAITRELP